MHAEHHAENANSEKQTHSDKGKGGDSASVQKSGSMLLYITLILAAGLIVFNQMEINEITAALQTSSINAQNQAYAASAGSFDNVIPKGVPPIYGSEIGVSFDGVSASNPALADATIAKLSAYDRSMTLTGDKLKRYIAITSQISCEYCCGAESIIFPDGRAACGCAHSYAMRGLAKYLVDKHGGEYTNDQILEELGKWKTLFFPGKLIAKAGVLKEQGIEFNYINLASNKYRDIEKGVQPGAGGMVGGC